MIGLAQLGALRAIGLGLMFAGVTSIAGGIWGYAKGQAAGAAKVQAKFDRAISEHNAAAMAASEAYRRLEQDRAALTRAAERRAYERQAEHAKVVASLRAAADADRRLLVNRIAELARSGAAGQDSGAAEGGGAAAIGDVLADALRNAAEATAAAESNADAYRALREAWPRD